MPLLNGKHTCSCAHRPESNFHSKSAGLHFPPDLSLEPKHNKIDLAIDIENRIAEGTLTISVICNHVSRRTLELDAINFENLKVIDTSGKNISYVYDGKKIAITWEDSFEKNEMRDIAISYRVREPIAGLYFSSPKYAYQSSGIWAATDHETERARHWLPCIDHLNVRTTLEFRLQAKKEFIILANGAKTKEEIKGDQKITTWKLDFPCPSYLTCFAIGDFTTYEDGEFEGIPVSYFSESKYNPEDLERSFGRTKKMLSWMTKKLDLDFPFPKYFQFALPDIGGAMENISLVSWDDIFLLDENLATEWTWLLDQINVHEMAHSYFGDAVVCRDYSHVWLKESWATYMETCWLEDQYGEDEKQYDFYRNAYSYFNEADSNYKRPIVMRSFDSSWDMFDAHLYPGGAARLHTLRNELGTETFWEGVKLYLKENLGKVVETHDFRKSLEKVSGRSLVQFFEQWFYTPSYPEIDASFTYDGDKKEGVFVLKQKQVSDKNEFIFKLPITLLFGDVRKNILLDKKEQSFRFTMEKEPEIIRIDPDATILIKLSFNPGDAKLRKQLSAPDVIGRIYAAKELAKSGGIQNIEAIASAYKTEVFWGVKQQIFDALSKIKSTSVLPFLREIIENEKEPLILASHYQKISSLKDDRISEILRTKVKKEMGYWAKKSALEALGNLGENAPLALLEKNAKEESLHGIAQFGAVIGLANTRRKEALGILIDVVKTSQQFRVRMEALKSIGALVRFLEKEARFLAIEFLIHTLSDDDLSVAEAAALALTSTKAMESFSDLKQFRSRLPHQFQVSLDRAMTGMQNPKDDVNAKLSKQVDDMRKEMNELMGRIEKLET